MSIAEAVLDKLNRLPAEKQQQVLVYVESLSANGSSGRPYSFLDTALNLKLDGPSDWAANLEEYLHGDRKGTV